VEEAEKKAEDVLSETSEEDREALVRLLPEVLAAAPPAGDRRPERPPAPPAPPAPTTDAAVPLLSDPDDAETVEDRLLLDPRFAEGEVFLWRATTSDAHPRVSLDDLVLVRRDAAPADGDLVLFHHEGRWRLGLYARPREGIRIAFPRPELPPLPIEPAAFRPAGVVRLVLRTP
jgi:hypothetical protein